MISTIIIGITAAALFIGGLSLLISLTARLGPHCRCGHHRSVHRRAYTECAGYVTAGLNELGIRQWQFCTCQSYRKTDASYWKRIRTGTEEWRR